MQQNDSLADVAPRHCTHVGLEQCNVRADELLSDVEQRRVGHQAVPERVTVPGARQTGGSGCSESVRLSFCCTPLSL